MNLYKHASSLNFTLFLLAFDTPTHVVHALVDTTELEIAIMDSYLLTYFHEVIKREPVRVKANKELPINYGLILAPNSENFTKCFTKYIKNNPQDIFNSVRKNLKPLKVRVKCIILLIIKELIISMTKLLDADWLRGVQLFH
jgi:hypothetical protein